MSELDAQGRAVINGLEGPGSFLIDLSFRYQLPLGGGLESLDFFFDMFNMFNRENVVPPTGNRAVGELHGPDGGAVPAADAVRRAASLLRSRACMRAGIVVVRGAGRWLCGAVAVRSPRWNWAS